MKKCLMIVAIASCMLLSGCFTVMSVDQKQYWAVPVAVPLDIVTSPVQLGLGYMLGGMAGVK